MLLSNEKRGREGRRRKFLSSIYLVRMLEGVSM
jgi:hypothetical protein